MSATRFPEQQNVRLPDGWRMRIERLSARDGTDAGGVAP